MNKKKFASVGFFAIVVVIGAGIAYYCYPSAINNALGISSSGIDTISDGNLLSMDNGISSSSVSVDDDGVAADRGAAVSPAEISSSPSFLATSSAATTPSVTSCAFPTNMPAPSTTHDLIFNEISWMGSPLSSIAEWMELKNVSTSAVDLSGWGLFDASGKIKISFTDSDGTLAAGGLLLLSRETTTPGNVTVVEKIYSGDLVNTGDTLAIMDPQCDVSDYLDASGGWPAGDNTTKQTLERDADGIGWHTSAQPGGTPGAENSTIPVTTTTALTVPVPISTPATTPVQTPSPQNIASIENTPEDASTPSDPDMSTSISAPTTDIQSMTTSTESGSNDDNGTNSSADNNMSGAAVEPEHVLIASVQIAGASSSNDLVGLYNPTAKAIDMSGWKLHKKSSTGTDYSLKVFPAGSIIAAGQSFVWANSEGGFSETAGANVSSTETLAANNSVALMDAAGTIVDAVAWGTGANQYGEGPPYPTSPGANQLLSRLSSGGVLAETDDNSNDFTIQ